MKWNRSHFVFDKEVCLARHSSDKKRYAQNFGYVLCIFFFVVSNHLEIVPWCLIGAYNILIDLAFHTVHNLHVHI